jgi:large subunit ribosomal protein L18
VLIVHEASLLELGRPVGIGRPGSPLRKDRAVKQRQAVQIRRERRQRHVRKRLSGTPERPRLAVFRSSKHIYAQVINDQTGRTLASASSLDPEIRTQTAYGGNKSAASIVGRLVAQRAKQAGIDKICFDRRSYKYHGRIQALADAAREAGLKF